MFKNYLSIALRNIKHNPLYSFINIFSLAIGLAACLVIYLFINDEKAFDTFHAQYKDIYRLEEVQNFSGTNVQKVALSMPGMGPYIAKEFPEVVTYTRYWGRGKEMLQLDEEQLLIESVSVVDSTFFKVFGFELLAGDINTALNSPNSMLLDEDTALKFFASLEDAHNNTITWRNDEYKITGILKNVPENSHLQFNVLVSMTTYTSKDADFNEQWGSNWLNTYFVLHPNVDINEIAKKFPVFLSSHMDNPEVNQWYKLYLQPLVNVHLATLDVEHDYNNYRKFNGAYLDVFYVVGIFILLIASVNFMNLTTARSSHRWKEIGVRKAVGAKKAQLFQQFIFESVLLAVLSLALALLFDLLAIPVLNDLIGRQLEIGSLISSGWIMAALAAGTLLLGMLTGIYPSLYMTSFKMTSVLKGGGKADGRSVFRSSLVVVQFGLAVAMIVSTLVVVQQMSFMNNSDIGFDKDQVMLVSMNKEANEKFETLRTELKRGTNILGVTASGQRLGNNFHQWGFKVKADTGIVSITPSNVNVDYEYLEVYGMELIEGRTFSKDNLNDNGKAFIINETFAKELGLKETVGTPAGHGFYNNDSLGTIIGVVKDFNFNSLHFKVNTLEMVVHPDWGYDEMSIKIDGTNATDAIAYVKQVWDEQISSYPLDYTFLSEHFDKLYRSDQQMSSVIAIMATLAILISCLGLFGLAAITTERKTKEIGIRKAMGATTTQITVLLSRTFTKLIILSFILASPVTYLLLKGWLEGFAYRIDINPLLFLLGGMFALVIALITISFHTVRSAKANPVRALRYE